MTHIGGTPIGRESELITAVRSRFNSKFDPKIKQSARKFVDIFLFAAEPISEYLSKSLGLKRTQGLPRVDYGIRVYEIFKLVSARTRIPRRFGAVTDSDEEWSAAEAGLQQMLSGKHPEEPASVKQERASPERLQTEVAPVPPFWTGRRFLSLAMASLAWLVYYLRDWVSVGRNKFYITCSAIFLVLAASGYWIYGPDNLMCCRRRSSDRDSLVPDDDVASESQAGSEFESVDADDREVRRAPDPESPSEAQERGSVKHLAEEMKSLKEMVQQMASSPTKPQGLPTVIEPQLPLPAEPMSDSPGAGPLGSLMQFATGASMAGPYSQETSAPMVPPPFVPPQGLPAQGADPAMTGWAPFAAKGKTARQASQLAQAYAQLASQKNVNPYWGGSLLATSGELGTHGGLRDGPSQSIESSRVQRTEYHWAAASVGQDGLGFLARLGSSGGWCRSRPDGRSDG